ncbi:MAG: hypothetical protein Q8K75_04955 [Chlamydiales bacterium]|nr:hypothetical protein [Chlamydiales bacterium]
MEVHDSGSIHSVPQEFSVEKHQDSAHEPTVRERTNSVANEPLKESGEKLNPQNDFPKLSKKVTFNIPEKSANVSLRIAAEGPKRMQSPSMAKRMGEIKAPPPPPRPDRPLGAAEAKPNEAIQKPAIDAGQLDKAEAKGKPVIKEMASTEKSYSDGLNKLVARDYNGKSVLTRLSELASPQDKAIIEKYRDSARTHLKHSKAHLSNMESAAGKQDYSAALKDVSKAYNRMGDYMESNADLSGQFSDLQGALARTQAKEPEKFAALETKFKGNPFGKGFKDIASTPMQRMPRHALLTREILKGGTLPESAENKGITKANAAIADKVDVFNAQLAGIKDIHAVRAAAISPGEEAKHEASQEFMKSIAAGDEQSKTGLIYGANAVWSEEGFKGVSVFDQISLAYSSANPQEKKALAGALVDMLETNASLPISNEAKAHAKGVVYDMVLKTLADGIDGSSKLKTLADKNLAPTEAKPPVGGGIPELASVNAELSNMGKMYDLASAKPEDSYQNFRTFIYDGMTNLNLSELDFQGSKDATTLGPTLDHCQAGIASVINMVTQSPNPSKAYNNAIKMLAMAQTDEASGLISLLSAACNSPALKGSRYMALPRTAAQEAILDVEVKSTTNFDRMTSATQKGKPGMPEITVTLSMLEGNRQGLLLENFKGKEGEFIQSRLSSAANQKKTFADSLKGAGKAQTQKPLASSYGQFKAAGDSMIKLFDQLSKTEYERPRGADGFVDMDQPRGLNPLWKGSPPNPMAVFSELNYARLEKKR